MAISFLCFSKSWDNTDAGAYAALTNEQSHEPRLLGSIRPGPVSTDACGPRQEPAAGGQHAVALMGRPGVEDHSPEYPHGAQKDPGYLVRGQTLSATQPAKSGH